jgi:DNA polymerase III epsilon subunit-like protein
MILWLDTETTGYNPDKNGIVEIAAIMEIGDSLDRYQEYCNPGDVEYMDDAEAVNGISKARANTYPTASKDAVMELFLKLRSHVREQGRKFVVAGYNVQFDVKFFRHIAVALGGDLDTLFTPYSEKSKYLDVYPMAKKAMRDPKATENHKLRTMLDYFEIQYAPESLHTALGDITATKALYEKLKGLDGKLV